MSKGKKKLTKKEIENFKEELVNIQAEMLLRLKESKEALDGEISLSLNQGEASILNLVNRALEKIEQGTYGICDVTSELIPLARLKAMPYAIMTVQAQEMLEKRK